VRSERPIRTRRGSAPRGIGKRLWTHILSAGAVALLLGGCGPSPTRSSRTEGEPTEAEFEAARADAGRLITGSVGDWRRAERSVRIVYAMASVRVVDPAYETNRSKLMTFITCIDQRTASAADFELLTDYSYDCVRML
jgi:hypothetical protein